MRLLALLLSSSNPEFAQIIKGLRNEVLFLLKKFIMSETVPPWAAEWFEFLQGCVDVPCGMLWFRISSPTELLYRLTDLSIAEF